MKISQQILPLAIPALSLLASSAGLAGDLTWTGAANNFWNTSDINWSGDATVYSDGDNVLFDSPTSGEITGIVSRSPGRTEVDSPNKVTFTTGIMGDSKPVGGPSILTGELIKNGTGELELGDPGLGQQFGPVGNRNRYENNFTGIIVNEGTLRYRSRAALGNGTVTLAGGVKIIQASEEGRFGFNNEAVDNDFFLSGGLVEFPMAFGNDNKGVWIRDGIVSGPGGIKVTGSSRSLAMSGDNTFSGGVTIETGGNPGIFIGSYTALGTGTYTASQSNPGNGGLAAGADLPGTAGSPNGVTNPVVITAGNFFNVRCQSNTATLRLSGDISGAGTLYKWNNDSTVILSGNNSYSGGTVVSDGTLVCEGVEALGEGPLTIASGALLRLDFIGTRNIPSLTIDGSPVADGTYGSSSSPAENSDDLHFAGSGIVSVGPPKEATITGLAQTGGSSPTDIGLPLTFTANVFGGTPTGTVSFYDGLALLGSDVLDGSYEASITTTELVEGGRVIVAQYEGDATYASSTSPGLSVDVRDDRPASSTELVLSAGSNPSPVGTSVTYTATVTGASPGGDVIFYNRDQEIGTSSLDGSFQATITTSTLAAGPRLITAEYQGDAGNKPSADSDEQVVNAPAGNGKLKVFVLAGQSNMQGHGKLEMGRNPENPTGPLIEGGLGSLRRATVREPKKFSYLLDPGNPVGGQPGWTTRDDVWISFWGNDPTVERRGGVLDSGFGVGASLADERIGPEFGFGQVVGAGLGDEVLIIKTAWGGKSLYVDFRPPSSGGTTGPYYLSMVEEVHEVLDNLTTYYPGYDGNGFELVGFGWHQGWNDRVNSAAVAEYEANLANLIRDFRSEFGVSDLPFVIANTGLASAASGPGTLIEAQGNVADPVLYPEFAGTVTTVDTRPLDFGEFQGTNNQGYHWWGNGESYLNIGTEMGEAMLALQAGPSAFRTWAADAAQGLTAGVNDGPLQDPDLDGISNLSEFVLGGNPLLASPEVLPVTNGPAGGDWTFEYNRSEASASAVTQLVEYSYDLEEWFEIAIPITSDGAVTITPGDGSDLVSVVIPPLGSSGFVRLIVTE